MRMTPQRHKPRSTRKGSRDYPEIAALKQRRDSLGVKGNFGQRRRLDERIYKATHRRLAEEVRAAARKKLQALSKGRRRRAGR